MKRIRPFLVAAATAVLAVTAVGCDSSPHPSKQGAAVMCESFVKKQLKSPGSAKFSGVTETKIKVLSDKKPWKYQVAAWVDSENSFGGLVRNPYVCTISTKDDKNWTLVKDLKFTRPQ